MLPLSKRNLQFPQHRASRPENNVLQLQRRRRQMLSAAFLLSATSVFALLEPDEIFAHVGGVVARPRLHNSRGRRGVSQAAHVLARETRGCCYEPARISVPKRVRHSTICGWRAARSVSLSRSPLPFHRDSAKTLSHPSYRRRDSANFDLVTKCSRCSGRPRSPSPRSS